MRTLDFSLNAWMRMFRSAFTSSTLLVNMSPRKFSFVPSVLVERLQHYYLTYKLVPGRRASARVAKAYGRNHALKVVRAAMADYAAAFPDGTAVADIHER